MKEEEIKCLTREHLALRKGIENLQEELGGLKERYDEVGDLLYGYRSRSFIQSVLFCLTDLEREYGDDAHYEDLLSSIMNILQNFKEYDADRREYTPKELLHLYGEEVD